MPTNRPTNLKDFAGQGHLKPLISGMLETCNKTHKAFPHTLAFGPPGVGKTTLASCISGALDDYTFVSLTASKDWTADTLRRILLDLPIRGYSPVENNGRWIPGAPKYMVFIDEVSELRLPLWESILYNAMEDREIHTGAIISWLPVFTLFAATTSPYLIPPPGLSRFGLQLHLQPYGVEDLCSIIARSYPKLDKLLIKAVAQRSRGIARLALNYAEGVADHGLSYMEVLGIDSEGLNELDRAYIAALESNKGESMSLASISNIVREAPRTLQAFVEPELLRLGKITISAHGRYLVSAGRGPVCR